ncbi:MAG TPA: VWA domain-containing protein [Terracidiphilus sp.]
MRKAILLTLTTMMIFPAGAARRVTVAQLTETLAAATAEHHSDEDIARQVGGLELSERLTDPTLDRFAARMPLQPHTALALQLLADQSSFLDPPPDELPATAPPDNPTEQQMLEAARAYAVQTWGRMPNFFVTRVTNRFDDSPHAPEKGAWPIRAGLQLAGTSSQQITFRDGKEVLDSTPAPGSATGKAAGELGLRSWGEFGPALTVVLADVANRKIVFAHWEQTAAGLTAVFRYNVPQEASHYAVVYGAQNEKVLGRTQFGYGGRERSAQQVANIPKENELKTYSETPGYHGTIAIDPATGAVLRITIEAELSSGNPLRRAGTMIEYRPVTIGDRKFICPVRSLAISEEPTWMAVSQRSQAVLNGVGDDSLWQTPSKQPANSMVLLINETSFTNYHRLGSTSRIITDGAVASSSAPDGTTPGPADHPDQLEPPPQTSVASAPVAPAPSSPQLETQVANAAPLPPAPLEARVLPPAASAEPVIPEISMDAVKGLPDVPASETGPPGGFSIKVVSRLVDVGVVAYDKKGHPVADLKADDFEIYDNGRKQELRFFGPAPVTTAPLTPPVAAETMPYATFTNRVSDSAAAAVPAQSSDGGATILLIDESHIAWADMNYACGQMLQFLGSLAPTERVGLYSMTGLGFRVLVEATTDHAALMARLKAFMPTAQSVSNAQDEEMRNRQQFNEVHNQADLNSVNGNHGDVPDADQPVDPQLMTMGSNPARSSLIILAQVARHLSAMAGHKNLVWVSSDNVFADWQEQQVGIDKSPKEVQAFAGHVQEAMNDAHTAVYPFDVSQLEGGAIGADIQHRNVELTQAAADNAATAAAAGGPAQSSGGHNTQPGRITAETSQDLHPIQGPIREVAAATGGRTIRRSGDLAAALNGIVEDGHATYQLSFSPQGPADDQYHTIVVKLAGRRGLSLRYRTGYQFQKEPATLKDRFQQAMWRPLDVSEIAVSADVEPSGSGASVRMNIAAGDLEMEQLGGRWTDKLDIFFIQRDDAGLHAHLEGQTLGLRLKSSTYQNILPKGVPFERAVELRPGMASLRVLVVDENSGRMGSVTIPSVAMRVSP